MVEDPTRRPIVACNVVRDNATSVHLRVYCPREGASIPVERCDVCAAHISLPEAPGDTGFVRCGPQGEEACEKMAEAPPIGAVVRSSVRTVHATASLEIALSQLTSSGAEPILVVDDSGSYVGSLSRTEAHRLTHRAPLPERLSRALQGSLPQCLPWDEPSSAQDAMSEAKVAIETTSIQEVLRIMAASKLRYLAVVAEDGTPLGLVSDVEALRLLVTMR